MMDRPPAILPGQLELQLDGPQLRDAGMARVDARPQDAPWRALADVAIRELADRRVPFTAEDVCAFAGRPDHPNAVGARMSAAARRGLIRRVGFRPATRPERHANVAALWIGADR